MAHWSVVLNWIQLVGTRSMGRGRYVWSHAQWAWTLAGQCTLSQTACLQERGLRN